MSQSQLSAHPPASALLDFGPKRGRRDCGAGCEPAADWQSACGGLHTALGRRVDNKSLLPNTPPIRLSARGLRQGPSTAHPVLPLAIISVLSETSVSTPKKPKRPTFSCTPFLAFSLCLCASVVNADDPYHAGLIALQRGDLATAQTNLETASRLAPRDGRIWVALSQTYWRLHRNSDAEEAAGKAAVLSPEDAVVLQALAIYYTETNQTLKAARTTAKYSAGRAAELYFEAAKPLLDQQKFAGALVILQESVTRVPKNAQLELALGVACYGLRRFDDAAGAFLRTIDIAPETEQPYTFLGKILDQIPRHLPQVTKRFAEYEAAHPANPAAYLLHAKALDAQSLAPETALTLLAKSIELNATDAPAHFEMGTVLDRLYRFPDAAAEFEKAAQLAPSDPATHYRLARDYDRIGKPEAARAEREKHARLVKAQEPIR